MATNIEWTDCADNIITVEGGGWWCRKISAGCLNCYAANLNQNSFFGGNKLKYSGEPPRLMLKRDILKSWARQTKSKKHFVASMTDVFGEWVDRQWQFEFLDAMWSAPKQTFQILTKRPDVMANVCLEWMKLWDLPQIPDNIWLGTTVENQDTANKRIPILMRIPASVRFLSCEPLLEKIDLTSVFGLYEYEEGRFALKVGSRWESSPNWIIVGGESGKDSRPCHVDWVRSLVRQCQSADVPVFVKQLGGNPVFGKSDRPSHFPHHYITGKGGDLGEFPDDLKIREFPNA